jgi:hypothetical protein
MVVADEFDDPAALASALVATKPMEASDSVSASIFFMTFPFQ